MLSLSIINSYKILKKVLLEGAYVHIALQEIDDPKDRDLVTKIVYGVLENYYFLVYNISLYYEKKPSNAIIVLLLISTYSLKFLSISNYVVIDESVKVVPEIGKKQLKGFVNGLLRKIDREEMRYPDPKKIEYEQILYNLPIWMIRLIKKEYPLEYKSILKKSTFEKVHLRLNLSYVSNHEFEVRFPDAIPTRTGYFVRVNEEIKDLFKEGKITFQGLASTLTVDALGEIEGKKILDVCSAPGGKSIYAFQKGAIVTACDIHEHRVKLVKNYAKRMKADIKVCINDATIKNEKFIDAYDVVMVDAPCSGLGVISKRQDIINSRTYEDIKRLATLQKQLLDTAKLYVKVGGFLLYSTCTITSAENTEVIRHFLQENSNFKLDSDGDILDEEGKRQFLPDGQGMDGHFIARLLKEA